MRDLQSSSIILLPSGLPGAFLCPSTECMFVWVRLSHIYIHFFSAHSKSMHPVFSQRTALKSCIEHQIQQLMFFAGYHISHQGSGLGVYFMSFLGELQDWKWKCCQEFSFNQKSKGVLLMPPELCCFFALRVCVRVCVCVCILGVVLLNVANSDAHADGSAEMASVSNMPLALWEQKDVPAANASEHSRFQINFPCCLLGRRRRWGLERGLLLKSTSPTWQLLAYFALLQSALTEHNINCLRLLI